MSQSLQFEYPVFDNNYFRNALILRDRLASSTRKTSILGYSIVGEMPGGIGNNLIALRQANDINRDSPLCVLKTIQFNPYSKPEQLKKLIQEAIKLTHFRSTFITKVEEIIEETIGDVNQYTPQKAVYIKLPYCAGGSLRQRIQAGDLSLEESVFHLISILISLDEIHKRGLIHQDLKPENVFFRDSKNLRDPNSEVTWRTILADFGLAKYLHTINSTSIFSGTLMYSAPEQLLEGSLSKAVDIWAWGLIAWEIVTKKHLYREFSDLVDLQDRAALAQAINSYIQTIGWKEKLSEWGWLESTLKRCFSLDASERPSAEEIIHFLKDRICFKYQGCLFGKPLNAPKVTYATHLADCFYMLNVLENEYNWDRNGELYSVVFDTGWAGKYNRVRDLLKISQREAVEIICSVLGPIGSLESVFSQLEQNPNLSNYQDCLSPTKVESRSSQTRVITNQIPRDGVLTFIDNYLICLIDLILQGNLPADLEAISYVANLCSAKQLFQKCEHICRLAQAYLLLGEFKKARRYIKIAYQLAKTKAEVQLCGVCFNEILIAERDYEASLIFCQNHVAHIGRVFVGQIQDGEILDWKIRIATSLFESRDYETTFSFLANSLDIDIFIIIYLVCIYHLENRLNEEIWGLVKALIFNMNKVSHPKLQAGLECAWLYGEREFCARRAQAILAEPSIDLPMYRYYKEIYESFAKGQYPTNLVSN